MSSFFSRARSFAGNVGKLAKKVYSKGTHLAKKVQRKVLIGAGKARHFIHDAKTFIDKVQKISPLATEIVDELTDLIPGAAPIKKGLSLGISAFNTISNLADRADDRFRKAQNVAVNPNIRTVLDLFK